MPSLIKAPRIPELLFAAVLIWLFATGQGWSVLLADGDTGWHIRNGEQIIETGTVPHRDAFSFDSAGHPWFSWEWLSDVIFARLFRTGGLKAVAVFCGILIAASVSVLFRHMVWRGVGVCIALPLTLLTVGASSIHYLARPHVLGLLFFALTAWVIDRERSSPDRLIWSLPLLFLVWTNCHGSFLAGLAMLGLWTVEGALAIRPIPSRPLMVLAACSVATLGNPYGWRLHFHAAEFLRSSWIQNTIEEFQSPRFRSESMFQYEFLLIAGLSALPWLLRRKQFYPCFVILFWTHQSLAAVRHIPLYCLAACPFTSSWLQLNWDRVLRHSRAAGFFTALNAINQTWNFWNRGFTVWPAALCLVIVLDTHLSSQSQPSFPANKFPVHLVERNMSRFGTTAGHPARVFSSDQWSDYLIFRLYPSIRVYFDGRSDFFGPWRGQAYQQLMAGEPDAAKILDSENIDLVLVPKEWALSGILPNGGQWQVADADEQAVLFVRDLSKVAAGSNQKTRDRR
jgi:hypothetical protein